MPSEGSRSTKATIGEIGVIKAQLHLLEQGFNVAMPLVPDGTDMLAYDRGVVWQLQIKTITDIESTRYVDFRVPKDRRKKDMPDRYQYIDAYIVCDLTGDRLWTVAASWTPPGGQMLMSTVTPISAAVLRHLPINCEGLHPWPGSCAECKRCHAAMPASDRVGVSKLLCRGRRRVAKIATNKKEPRKVA